MPEGSLFSIDAKSLFESALIAGIMSAIVTFFLNRKERVEAARLEWKKETAALLGQVYVHLNRTSKAFHAYDRLEEFDKYFEDEIIYASNKKIRDIILENGHHIPPDLLTEANALVEHYDAWLVEYNNTRNITRDTKKAQIYVGPKGYRFPEKAEQKFKEAYIRLFKEINGKATLPALANRA